MPQLPKARTSDILEMEADHELLIYDLRINKAYNLNETSKTVYRACGGNVSFDELKQRHKLTDDLIYFALAELAAIDLIDGEVVNHFAGLSRREVIRRVGLTSMIALPVIAGITAPPATHAASNALRAINSICTTAVAGNSTECASGNCVGSLDNARQTTLRCCTSTLPDRQGTTDFLFVGGSQNACDTAAASGYCCSVAANFDGARSCYCR